MRRFTVSLLAGVVGFMVLSSAAFAAESGSALARAGLVLQTLSSADLDAIQEEMGYRVGVLVNGVTPGSPAAQAGLRTGDVLFTVGSSGVDATEAVERALTGAAGKIPVLGVRAGEFGEYEALQCVITMPAPAAEPRAEAAAETPQEAVTKAGDDLAAKLKALDAAHQAGILSDEEYALKKKEVEAQIQAAAPRLDEATQQKLQALEAAHDAGILSDEEYARKKAELLGGEAEAPSGPAKGKVYRHVIGFSLWYPAGWTIKEHDDSLQLVPPKPATTPDGPSELYFIIGERVIEEGITRADDPRVVEYLDQQILSLSPALARPGEPTSVGKGVAIEWKGTAPNGNVVLARASVRIINEYAVALLAIGLKAPLERRSVDLRRISDSFGFGEGKTDPALAGTWRLVSTYALTNESPFETDWSRARMVSETQSTLTLRADGTWSRTDASHMIAIAGDLSIESKDTSVEKGRWNAGEGALYLLWGDGSWEDYKYELRRAEQGRQLRLVTGTKGELWEETAPTAD